MNIHVNVYFFLVVGKKCETSFEKFTTDNTNHYTASYRWR